MKVITFVLGLLILSGCSYTPPDKSVERVEYLFSQDGCKIYWVTVYTKSHVFATCPQSEVKR